ncbi:tetratricopeptide repeat protein [Geobacter pickeringii]|uniref:Membrane protein n=1 Tax=Geobacter pickeringii TaxID=345632 RepID=A0A0B5BDZ1_9BACT|nr:membrane protein [Geobacter pickeringii]AJE04933.1 membrane protein [Geobacter pickeringii]
MTSGRFGRRYLLVVMLLATFVAYGNTFRNNWSYDDIPVVVENIDAHSLAGFLEHKRPGRPLRVLTYIPEYKLFGDKPAGYRIQQLLWHGANGFLLVLLLQSLGVETLPAILAGLFFLVHPLQVESVANISHRKELLALFFCLATLFLHRRLLAAEGRKRLVFAAAGLGTFGLSLLANQTAITFPAVLVLYELLFVPKERRFLIRRPLLAGVGAAAAAGGAFYLLRGLLTADQLLTVYSKNNFIASKSYYPLFMGVMKSFGFYLSKILVPTGLAPEYAVRFSEDFFQPAAWGGMALLVAVAAVAVFASRRAPLLSFGLGWFLLLYLPISNLVPAGYMIADRYLYMPLAGVAIAFAWGVQKLRLRVVYAAAGAVLVLFTGLTVVQNTYWYDEHTLWRHAAEVDPGSTWAQESAAYSYYVKGEYDQAREHALKALAINRFNTKAYLVLAQIEEGRGDIAEAVRNYEMFSEIGEAEYPALVAGVRDRLPELRERLRQIELYKKGNP